MSNTPFGFDISIMQRICRNVCLINQQLVDTRAKFMCVIARVALTVQNKLYDSGTCNGVEKRGMTVIKPDDNAVIYITVFYHLITHSCSLSCEYLAVK